MLSDVIASWDLGSAMGVENGPFQELSRISLSVFKAVHWGLTGVC